MFVQRSALLEPDAQNLAYYLTIFTPGVVAVNTALYVRLGLVTLFTRRFLSSSQLKTQSKGTTHSAATALL
jgi:hypothetical protein